MFCEESTSLSRCFLIDFVDTARTVHDFLTRARLIDFLKINNKVNCLYVLIMSRTRFRVNTHSIIA